MSIQSMDTLLLPAMECSSGASCLGSRCHTGLSQAVSCKPSFYAYVAGKGNYFHHCSAHLSLRQAPNSSFIPQAAPGGCSAQFSSIWGSQVPSKATVLMAPTSNCRKILEIRAAQPATQSTILRSMDTAGAVSVPIPTARLPVFSFFCNTNSTIIFFSFTSSGDRLCGQVLSFTILHSVLIVSNHKLRDGASSI